MRKWTPTAITGPEQIERLSRDRNGKRERITVASGWRFDDYDKDQFDDSGTTVVYDRTTVSSILRNE